MADVARAVEKLRLAEARLTRRRERAGGLIESDRMALLYILDRQRAAVPLTSTELGEHIGITSGATSTLLARLRAAGLVALVPYPGDLRRKLIVPTGDAPDADHDPVGSAVRLLASQLSEEEQDLVERFVLHVALLVGRA